MIVYVLFHETNTGSSEAPSDGYVEGVYATQALAEAAKEEAKQHVEGVVWDDETEPEDWQHDWRIEAHAVEGIEVPAGAGKSAIVAEGGGNQ